jgi:hypothetical protein
MFALAHPAVVSDSAHASGFDRVGAESYLGYQG